MGELGKTKTHAKRSGIETETENVPARENHGGSVQLEGRKRHLLEIKKGEQKEQMQ